MPHEHKVSENSGHKDDSTDVSYFLGFDKKILFMHLSS